MTGTIPTEIGYCVEMREFVFFNNQVVGTLPTELGNTKALIHLNGNKNQIVGTIPEEVYCNFELEEISMSEN